MVSTTTAPRKLLVKDTKGTEYELRKEMNRGGQGVVYRTHFPKVLVKGFTNKDEQTRRRWRNHMAWLIRQDLGGLKLAKPLSLLEEPRCGYVMELMDGLISLQTLLDLFVNAGEGSSTEYLKQGGLRRRIRILVQLAKTLNQLHTRGMLYGDLSPNNIFISDDPSHAETWLIDCDNISLEAHSGLSLHTKGYGAPEVVRGDSLLSSLTDCWSFAIIAYQLLTHNHPFKGEVVNEGDPEEENAALRGEHPWIYDTQDDSNQCFANLPIQLIENSQLPILFGRCFEQGRLQATERPSMAEWLQALTEVDERLINCANCGGNTLMAVDRETAHGASCFFCDSPVDDRLVMFEEFIELSEEDQTPPGEPTRIATGRKVWLQPGSDQELKRLMPTFSYDQWPSDHLRVEYTENGLRIHPLVQGMLRVQRGGSEKSFDDRPFSVNENLRGQFDVPYLIHVRDNDHSHIVWQFRW